MEISQLYRLFQKQGVVSTDTRKITRGSIFFALRGDTFDGSDFIEEALSKGAAYAISDSARVSGDKIIRVENSLATLQKLATYHRNSLGIKILAVTGSNGKTTTKELCRAVLSEKYSVYATEGNLNNHIGVPLTLLSMKNSTEVGIVEMGANHPGEISFLCSLAQPDYGLITNIGKAHLEGFGSIEAVAGAKGELFDYLIENKRIVIVNEGDIRIIKLVRANYENAVYYNGKHGIYPGNIRDSLLLEFEAFISGKPVTIKTNLIGKYNIENVLAAFMVGISFGVSESSALRAIAEYKPSGHRSQLINTSRNRLFMDSYNANPSSMAVAIKEFLSANEKGKLMILGEMAEVGPSSADEHEEVVSMLQANGLKEEVIFVGKAFKSPAKNAGFMHFDTTDHLCSYFSKNPLNGKFILVKGSRINKLEKLLNYL